MFFGSRPSFCIPPTINSSELYGIDRVDEDDPLARRQRPGRVNLAADEVEIVEDLGGLRVPGVARRRAGGVRDVARHVVARVFAAALRQETRPHQSARGTRTRPQSWPTAARPGSPPRSFVLDSASCAEVLLVAKAETTATTIPILTMRSFIFPPSPALRL